MARQSVYDCEVDAENGTALLVDEQAGAAAVDCRLSSSGQYLGVVAKSQATVALHGCQIGSNRWGVALGLHDEVYISQATANPTTSTATPTATSTRGTVLAPPRAGPLPVDAASHQGGGGGGGARAAAKRAAAERRDAEGERTGERPRKRSRLPISPVRGG